MKLFIEWVCSFDKTSLIRNRIQESRSSRGVTWHLLLFIKESQWINLATIIDLPEIWTRCHYLWNSFSVIVETVVNWTELEVDGWYQNHEPIWKYWIPGKKNCKGNFLAFNRPPWVFGNELQYLFVAFLVRCKLCPLVTNLPIVHCLRWNLWNKKFIQFYGIG